MSCSSYAYVIRGVFLSVTPAHQCMLKFTLFFPFFYSLTSDQTLTRQGPNPPFPENYHTLPKNTRQPSGSSPPPNRNLPSDYKYAQDRVSHLKMSQEERKANKDGTVWQLYEWQQRQQFKHGSPTAPLYVGSSDFIDRAKSKSSLDVPRSISVPPSPSDIPPPGPPKSFLPRRPHTPAERLTVKPSDERQTVDVPFAGSPRKIRNRAVKVCVHLTDYRLLHTWCHMWRVYLVVVHCILPRV